jgi:hypothetical protein
MKLLDLKQKMVAAAAKAFTSVMIQGLPPESTPGETVPRMLIPIHNLFRPVSFYASLVSVEREPRLPNERGRGRCHGACQAAE